jgi:hypothetical protein
MTTMKRQIMRLARNPGENAALALKKAYRCIPPYRKKNIVKNRK